MPRPKKLPTPPPKAHQRRWSEGSVKELHNGRYRAWRARARRPDGTTLRPSRTFSDREHAEAWAAGHDPYATPVMYLGQWLERWLSLRKPTVSPNTYDIYRRDVDACGDLLYRPIDELAADDWQARANRLLGRWSRYHVFIWRGNISVALRAAIKRGHLAENPILDVVLPSAQEQPPKAWTQAEVDRLLAASEGLTHWPWLVFSLGTGVRLGEARALVWDDVALAARTATIRASLDNARGTRGPTKTRKIRVVDIPDEVVPVLADLRKRQPPKQRLVFGYLPKKGQERAYSPASYRSWLATRCKDAGVRRLPPHSLRHTCASLAFARRVPVPDVAKQLGHTSETCARVYQHYINEGLRVMATALGASLRHRFSGPKRANGTGNGTR